MHLHQDDFRNVYTKPDPMPTGLPATSWVPTKRFRVRRVAAVIFWAAAAGFGVAAAYTAFGAAAAFIVAGAAAAAAGGVCWE